MSDSTHTVALNQHVHACIVAGASEHEREYQVRKLIAEWLEVSSAELEHDARVLWIQAENSTITRQRVAEVLHELSMHAFADTHRAIILDPADNLTPEAANMLLKSLEEPPEGVRFFLPVSTVARLLPTLRSRSSVVTCGATVPAMDAERATEFLRATIPGRLAFIAGLSDRSAQLQFLQDLLVYCEQARLYDAAEWLQRMIAQGEKSVNLRLILETFAVQFAESGQ